jgi:hypothetical protein
MTRWKMVIVVAKSEEWSSTSGRRLTDTGRIIVQVGCVMGVM